MSPLVGVAAVAGLLEETSSPKRGRNEDITKTYGYTNGGEDEALTDAQNQEHYLKVKREDHNLNRNFLGVLPVEKNPGAFQKVQPGAHVALPATPKRTQPAAVRASQHLHAGIPFRMHRCTRGALQTRGPITRTPQPRPRRAHP